MNPLSINYNSRFIVSLLLLLSIGGCSTIPLISPFSITTSVQSIDINKNNNQYKQNNRPMWIDSPPDDDEKNHYLVGLSNTFYSEKKARQDALRDARLNYAHYTGIKITEVSKMLSSLYSTSTTIFNPTMAAISQQTESVSANVRQISAKKWYWEKLNPENNIGLTPSYQYWVLVQVPHEEYQRVQQWKEQEILTLKSEKDDSRDQLMRKLTEAITIHQHNLATVTRLIEEVKPLRAIKLLNQNWVNLYSKQKIVEKEVLNHRSLFPFKEKIRNSQNETLNLIANIRDNIEIEINQHETQLLSSSQVSITSQVWMLSGKNRFPIPSFPLKLIDHNQEIIAKSITDKTGKSVFKLVNVLAGEIKIGIDMEIGENNRALEAVLANKLTSVKIKHTENITNVVQVKKTANQIKISVMSKFGDNQTYFEGDPISYLLSIDRDAYILMIFEDAMGNLIQIVPNINGDENFVNARSYIEIPSAISGFELSVSAPFGEESIYVYSSERPFPQFQGEFDTNGLYHLDKQTTKQSLTEYSNYLVANGLAHGEAKTSIKTLPYMASLD